jgi:hypothetical protein
VKFESEIDKFVILLMDEMHIRDDIVYDKHSEQSLTKKQSQTLPSLENSMLVLFVWGLFSQLKFSLCSVSMPKPTRLVILE